MALSPLYRVWAQGKARSRTTTPAPGQVNSGPGQEHTKRAYCPAPPRFSAGRGPPNASAGLGAWRAGRPAHPRARAQYGAGWRQPELTITMETRSRPRRDRSELAAPPLPPLLYLPVRDASILPEGVPNLFTCKNAVPGMPLHRLFSRVTRGMFDPQHPPGDVFVALISKTEQSHVVLAVFIAADFSFFVIKSSSATVELSKT